MIGGVGFGVDETERKLLLSSHHAVVRSPLGSGGEYIRGKSKALSSPHWGERRDEVVHLRAARKDYLGPTKSLSSLFAT